MEPFDLLCNTDIPEKEPSDHRLFLFQSQESEHYGKLRYIQRRKKEELVYQDWIRQRRDLEEKVQENTEENIKVRSSDNRVKFIYKYKGHEVLGTIFRFKITLIYQSLLRKWYISPSYSFVPEVIDLKGKLKSGTHYPLSDKVLDIIHDVIRSIDIFMTRLTRVYQFMYDVQKKYKDLQFTMNAIVRKMELIFTENAWPNDLQRSSMKDMIVVKLQLNKNIQVCSLAYKYIRQKNGRKDMKENINKLRSKLENFYDVPLKEAIERFLMGEERYAISQEQYSSENALL